VQCRGGEEKKGNEEVESFLLNWQQRRQAFTVRRIFMVDRAIASGVGFEGVTPILRVGNLAASVEYYVSKLGFKKDWEGSGPFASVSRGRCHIFLSEGDQGHTGTWVWIGVEDAEALFNEYRASGATVRHAPTNYPWAYEMQVEDLDGNVLRMGSDPKDDQPTGEWLDMHGTRWVWKPGDKWVAVQDGGAKD
jgi:catechol 2,3-dioxygenase-like lactoylglutathione lyase family enzyme